MAIMKSIISTEIKALALHNRLLDRLGNRADICSPKSLPGWLQKSIQRYLVPGLDYDSEPGTGGWPLPTGGRYRKLCFSPCIAAVASTTLINKGVHLLPTTEKEFIQYVASTTGITAQCANAFEHVYRFNAPMLFQLCSEMREKRPVAWRLLLSNEFDLAVSAWPLLRERPQKSSFKHPLVEGFMFLAELERASLIMRHITRANAIVNRRKILEVLGSNLPFRDQFKSDELSEVHRLLEYACLSTEAIRNFLFDRKDTEILAMPPSFLPWAAARGELPSTVDGVFDDPEIRAILFKTFSLSRPEGSAIERRKTILRDDKIVRWYGMTNEVLANLALEGGRDCFKVGKVTLSTEHMSTNTVLAQLSSAIRRAWDPSTQFRILRAAVRYVRSARRRASATREKSITLEGNLKLGAKRAKTYLPSHGRLGSVARFDPLRWKTPYADRELWAMFLAPSHQKVKHRMAHPERKNLKTSITVLRRVFVDLFISADASPENLKIACQLAAALSPISGNQQIAYAISKLEASPDRRKRLKVRAHRPGFRR